MIEPSTSDYTNERVKHLEMIQDVVARMAATSAAMKRYCILTVAVGAAIFKTIDDPNALAALIVLVVVFWGLDARYLQQERWFRNLYDQVRVESPDRRPDYRITPDNELRSGVMFWATVFSWSTAVLYLPLAALLTVFWAVL